MRTRDVITGAATVFALGLCVFALGGALRWTQAAVAACLAVAVAAQITSRRVFDRRPPLILALGVGAMLSVLQLLPLPAGLRAALSPEAEALRVRGAEIAEVRPWAGSSMDAPATLGAVCLLLILIATAFVALRWAASDRRRTQIVWVVAAACGLVALVVGLHELFGANRLYGFYTPRQSRPTVLGPFLNENHLGGFMALGAILSLGLAWEPRVRVVMRVLAVVNGLACLAVLLGTGSRGAALSLVAGGALTAAILLTQRLQPDRDTDRSTRRQRVMMVSVPIGIVATCTLLLVVYGSATGVAQQLANTSVSELSEPRSKFAAWRSATMLIEEAPWLGVGRGAFESAFTRVHPASAYATFSHAENEYLQGIVEWGLPGALLIAAGLAWVAARALRRWHKGPGAAGSLGALTALAIQSNVDFGVELLGLAMPAVMLAASLTYAPLRDRPGPHRRRSILARAALVAALLVACGLLLSTWTRTLADDREAAADVRDPEVLRTSIERHPLDYLAYAQLGQALLSARDGEGVRFLNHALMLHPTHAGLHAIAARLLVRMKRYDQAAGEYREAIRVATDPRPLVREMAGALPEAAHVLAAIPVDTRRGELVVRTLQDARRTDVAVAWLEGVLAAHPLDSLGCELLLRVTTESRRVGDAQIAARHCNGAWTVKQRTTVAKVMVDGGAFESARQILADVARWHGRIDDIGAAWMLLCSSHEGLQQWDTSIQCLRTLELHMGMSARRDEIQARITRLEKARAEARAAPAAVP